MLRLVREPQLPDETAEEMDGQSADETNVATKDATRQALALLEPLRAPASPGFIRLSSKSLNNHPLETDTPHNEESPDKGDQTPPQTRRGRKNPKAVQAHSDAASQDIAADAPAEPIGEISELRDGAVETDDAQASQNQEDNAEASGAAASDAEQADGTAVEALLFSTHSPLTAGRLAELLGLSTTKPIKKAVQALNADYVKSGRSFRIEQVAGGYQLLTLPDFGEQLKKLHQREIDAKLTKAALETLAIIAYKQPILRADIEAIRGVACGETIRSLMEKHLVKIAGRAEEPGRPILYGTTKRFLEIFGLNGLRDLPQGEGMRKAGT